MSGENPYPGVVGWPVEIFYDPIVFDVDPTTGAGYRRGVTIVPDVGSPPVLDQWEDRARIVSSVAGTFNYTAACDGVAKRFQVQFVDPLTSGTKRVLIVGDSGAGATDGFPTIVKSLLGARVTMCGTQGSDPAKHEGHPGWSYDDFSLDPTSPMISSPGVLDIASFFTAIGGAPDIAIFTCGTNDIFTLDLATIDAAIAYSHGYLNALIAGFKAQNAAIRCFIGTIWPGSYSEAVWDAAYPLAPTPVHWQWRMKAHRENEITLGTFGHRTDELIYIAPTFTGLSTALDYSSSDPFHFPTITGHVRTGYQVAAAISVFGGY